MAGRQPAFSYTQFKEVHGHFVSEGKEPTYDDIRGRLGGRGSDGLIASYKARLRGEQTELPDTAKIPDDLANQIRTGLMTLHSTLKAEAEASIRTAHEIQASEMMQISMRQDQIEEEHQRDLIFAREGEKRALDRLEDRDTEIQRLRNDLMVLQDARHRVEVSLNVTLSERDDARTRLEKMAISLEIERVAAAAAVRQLAVAEERANAQGNQLEMIKAECIRLSSFEQTANEVLSLKAVLQVHQEKVSLMAQNDREHQQTIISLSADNKLLQRERDEFRGRADEAQKMHLNHLTAVVVVPDE